MAFSLSAHIKDVTSPFAEWGLSTVLILEDKRFPWLLLVPRREGAVELFDLSADDCAMLMAETVRAAKALKAATGAEKINVAALGNVERQLHVHVVARNPGDAAWPGPVWGAGKEVPYSSGERAGFAERLRNALAEAR